MYVPRPRPNSGRSEPAHRERCAAPHDVFDRRRPLALHGVIGLGPDIGAIGMDPLHGVRMPPPLPQHLERVATVNLSQVQSDTGIDVAIEVLEAARRFGQYVVDQPHSREPRFGDPAEDVESDPPVGCELAAGDRHHAVRSGAQQVLAVGAGGRASPYGKDPQARE